MHTSSFKNNGGNQRRQIVLFRKPPAPSAAAEPQTVLVPPEPDVVPHINKEHLELKEPPPDGSLEGDHVISEHADDRQSTEAEAIGLASTEANPKEPDAAATSVDERSDIPSLARHFAAWMGQVIPILGTHAWPPMPSHMAPPAPLPIPTPCFRPKPLLPPKPTPLPTPAPEAPSKVMEEMVTCAGREHAVILINESGQARSPETPVWRLDVSLQSGSLNGKQLVMVAVGQRHYVAIDTSGGLHVWGDGRFGQLGQVPSVAYCHMPTQLPSTSGSISGTLISKIVAGPFHNLAIDACGQLHGWGSNDWGQLAFVSRGSVSRPRLISDQGSLFKRTIVDVATSRTHTLALDSIGQVHAWGDNTFGQLGTNGSKATASSPLHISSFGSLFGSFAVQIAAGFEASYAVDCAGRVHVWGRNSHGQLGLLRDRAIPNSVAPECAWVPTLISPVISDAAGQIKAVDAHGLHAVALDVKGGLHVLGLGAGSGVATLRTDGVAYAFPALSEYTLYAVGAEKTLCAWDIASLAPNDPDVTNPAPVEYRLFS